MKSKQQLPIYFIIIIFIITTPLFASANPYENLLQPPKTTDLQNCLGKLTIIHYPLYWRFYTYKGMSITYEPPENNPEYHYYYPETQGEIQINVTIQLTHRLHNGTPFIYPRYTWINKLIITDDTTDKNYIACDTRIECTNHTFITYTLSMRSTEPLTTNGENITLHLYLNGGAAPTHSYNIHELTWLLLPKLKQNLLTPQDYITLIIHPI